MLFGLRLVSVAAVVLSASVGAARADDSGLAGMHEIRRVGSKMCMTDHFHDGAGNGHNQATALKVAIKSWEVFTDLEYGSDWASFNNSVGKTIACGKGLSDITCNISSRPCKGGVMEKVSPASHKKRASKPNK
jgi:hypothetical protein